MLFWFSRVAAVHQPYLSIRRVFETIFIITYHLWYSNRHTYRTHIRIRAHLTPFQVKIRTRCIFLDFQFNMLMNILRMHGVRSAVAFNKKWTPLAHLQCAHCKCGGRCCSLVAFTAFDMCEMCTLASISYHLNIITFFFAHSLTRMHTHAHTHTHAECWTRCNQIHA